MVNGSPKANGNTARALAEVAEQLIAEGIDTEAFQLGAKPIRDCIGCGQCGKLGGRCTFDDGVVNEAHRCRRAGRWLCLWLTCLLCASQRTHPLGPRSRILCRRQSLAHKPGGAAAARRGGTPTTFDVLNKYFTINQMPVVASTYWNNVFGRVPGDADGDAEGLATMRNIGKNMAWLLHCIEGRDRLLASKPPGSRSRAHQLHQVERRNKYMNVQIFGTKKSFDTQEGPTLFF